MRTTPAPSARGPVLPTLGLVAMVLAIIAGFLAMHVFGGIPVTAMETASMPSPAATTSPAVQAMVPNHAASTGIHPATHLVAEESGMGCGGFPSDGHVVGGHEMCVPAFGPDLPALLPPRILAWVPTATAFTSAPGPKSVGRIPDPPSLAELSILRT
ncbi:DUF6153 family protein [Paeniglutamicibacter gangotriensis]|uniref:Uncharacterized protein n=1 Tax=Paeniglutamicibacter gangotriensis TaxID=254787 RepID=A0A5B0E206_9MICC|nr:DUF6153 family protein [Paeniglutamicibacter gangotriensis]KAA0973044.1 hypothetical protein FQ154_20135 [Paeniglutamicibacter gangotriensis]